MTRDALFSNQRRSLHKVVLWARPRKPGRVRRWKMQNISSPQERVVGRLINSIATKTVAPQNAVQRITSLVRNKSRDSRLEICLDIWHYSIHRSRKSQNSAVTITDFLLNLSQQSQEEYEHRHKHASHGPIILEDHWGLQKRLWRDMPGMYQELYDTWNDIWFAVEKSNRKATIDRFLKDVFFFSLLYRSSLPEFDSISSKLYNAFYFAADWPLDSRHRDSWDIWIPAIVVTMDTAGAQLKKDILSDPLMVGRWYKWQKTLLKIAEDNTVNVELRESAKQAQRKMAIDKRVTNHWWRQRQNELRKIVRDEGQPMRNRIAAKMTINALETEEGEEEEEEGASEARIFPSPSSPLQLLSPL